MDEDADAASDFSIDAVAGFLSTRLAKPVAAKTMMARLVSVIEHPRPFVRTSVYFGPCRRRRANDEYKGAERRSEAKQQAAE